MYILYILFCLLYYICNHSFSSLAVRSCISLWISSHLHLTAHCCPLGRVLALTPWSPNYCASFVYNQCFLIMTMCWTIEEEMFVLHGCHELAPTFPCSNPPGCGMLIGIWPSHCRNTKCVPEPQSCYCTRLQMLTDKVSIFWGKTDRSFTHDVSFSLGFTTLREQLMGL